METPCQGLGDQGDRGLGGYQSDIDTNIEYNLVLLPVFQRMGQQDVHKTITSNLKECLYYL